MTRVLVGRKRYRGIMLAIIAIVTCSIIAAFVFWPDSATPPKQRSIPDSVRSSVSFPIYYPEATANTFRIDPATVRSENGIVLYIVKTPNGDINITQQANDEQFDHDKFNHQTITDGTLVIAPAGKGAVGTIDGRLIGSLVAGKTWIIATPVGNTVTQMNLIQLLDTFKTD